MSKEVQPNIRHIQIIRRQQWGDSPTWVTPQLPFLQMAELCEVCDEHLADLDVIVDVAVLLHAALVLMRISLVFKRYQDFPGGVFVDDPSGHHLIVRVAADA